ncbi:hypothetical protein D9619_012424 [Psilocybe cf. subviscida]|uniref:NACHT domain-containing protein n=1 Tax=Psilocybe cf. subviscida TaxID=2480587 RepID=A0A8H5AR52_9AGAR|nr:hypothetical protein D9619_012424 [Psilocybe cf. subviscida]
MDSNPRTSAEQSKFLATIQTTTTPPAGSSAAGTPTMFNNAQNTYIKDSSFSITTNTTNIHTVGGSPLGVLHKRAAPNAILNAGGRADEVRCHPGTRKEVIARIEKWRDAQDGLTPPIFWLSGPAGAGKTAILQTVAERCNTQGIPQANFFFFRADSSRNNLAPLVATLVHQIILLYPSLRDPVATVLATNPLILDSVLEDQVRQLIVRPLQAIRQSSPSYVPPLLLIDGLDECESEEKLSQRQILHVFDKVLAEHSCPFRLLVASRDEPQIRAAFNGISSQLRTLYLDDQYRPERDIRTFVNDKFKRVRKTHPLAHTLDAAWPSVKDVEDVVKKSSGQFIYAATVMRFISHSSASPMLSLARVQGAAQISTRSPFSQLDAIYTYILSQVDDQDVLMDVLHAELLIQEYDVLAIEGMLVQLLEAYNHKYTKAMVQSCLAHLTPIAEYSDNRRLFFRHASFPDFLLDQSRSREYFVDLDAFNFKIQPAVWKGLKISDRLGLQIIAYPGLCRLHRLPPEFLCTLIAMNPSVFGELVSGEWARGMVKVADIFKRIYNLCTSDEDMTKYKQILRQWINTQPLEYGLIYRGTTDYKWPPYSHRYLAMAYINYYFMTEPSGHIGIALLPKTAFDARETALWLSELLHRIHKEKHVQEYDALLQKWTSWAAWNNVPLDGVDDLPNARWYLRRGGVRKWAATYLNLGSRPE